MKTKQVSESNHKKLSEICKIILSGTPKTSIPEYWNGDINWITPTDITKINKRYIYNTERKITKEGILNSSAKLLKKDTIVISARGTVGKLCIVPSEMSCNQSCYALESISELVRPLYLFYVLKNLKNVYSQIAHGTTFDTITMATFDEIKITLPSLDEQDKLIPKLDMLDSKIENLQKQNQILEQIIQSIFKSWFIDFDGQTEFVDSELGKIPKGWKVEKLGNLINHEKGFPFKSSDYKKFGRKIIRSSDLTKDSVNLKKCVCIDQNQVINYQKWILNQNDILITTVGSGMNHPESMVGRVIRVPSFAHQLLLNQNIVRIRAKNMIYHLFLLTKLQQVDFREFLAFRTQGSANQASLTLDTVFGFLIIEPSSEEIKKFYHIAESIYKKINFNQEIQIILTNIRDSLLPKLMSGEIRV